jgi:peroxiredoxin
MAARERPLSPHLQVYRFAYTMALSILHRATGIALSVGMLLLAWWLVAAAGGEAGYTQVVTCLGSLPGKVVLFAVPGAFTPGCSRVHLPGFVQQAQDVTDKGVDRIVCVSVNDAFVMGAWGEDQGVGESIVMLADGNGAFTEAMGHVMDGSGFGLGIRSKRYAAIIDNGVITSLDIDESGGVEVSSCSAVLGRL